MFCFKCGIQCIGTEVFQKYSETSGAPIFEKKWKCPTNICGHQGHRCDWKEIPRGFFSTTFWGGFSSKPDLKCSKCGSERRRDDD